MFNTNLCPNLWLNMSTTIKYLPFVRKLHSFNRIFKKSFFFCFEIWHLPQSLFLQVSMTPHKQKVEKKNNKKLRGFCISYTNDMNREKIVHDKLSDIQMEWMLGFPIINLCKKLLFLWFSLDIKRAVYDRRNLRNCHDMILIFNVLTDMYVYIYKENQTKNWLKWYDLTWTFDLAFKCIFYVLNNFYMSRYHYIMYNIYIFSALKKCKHLDKLYANVWAKIWNIFSL